jgi:succinate dehydrogenase / fumarate reductase iron-sulfur subunit
MMGNARPFEFRVYRYDPQSGEPARYQSYQVERREKLTVLDGLFDILDNQDGSLAFRFCCRSAVCGSCAMYIDGAYRLACNTQAEKLGRVVTVSPLPHLRPIKDLAVDMEPFWSRYEQIMPYLINPEPAPDRERIQSARDREKFNEMIDCILCGACYSACPMVWTHPDFIGPAALTKAYRFASDSRDKALGQRLGVVANEAGIWRCHTILNCADACPKNINPTFSIQQLKKRAFLYRLGFGRK